MSIWSPFVKRFIELCNENNITVKHSKFQGQDLTTQIQWHIDNEGFNFCCQPINAPKNICSVFATTSDGRVPWKADTVFRKILDNIKSGDNCFICASNVSNEKIVCGQCYNWVCIPCQNKMLLTDMEGELYLKCPFCRALIQPAF